MQTPTRSVTTLGNPLSLPPNLQHDRFMPSVVEYLSFGLCTIRRTRTVRPKRRHVNDTPTSPRALHAVVTCSVKRPRGIFFRVHHKADNSPLYGLLVPTLSVPSRSPTRSVCHQCPFTESLGFKNLITRRNISRSPSAATFKSPVSLTSRRAKWMSNS